MKKLWKGKSFVTSTVGSFPQPEQLRRARVRLAKGDFTEEQYQSLVNIHTLEWLRIQEEIDLDNIVTGEFERQDMAVFFGERFSGTRLGDFVPSYENRRYRPVIYQENIQWVNPIALPMYQFATKHTKKSVKETVTGPVTLFDWGLRGGYEYYRDPDILRKDLVAALRKEMEVLVENGVKVLQVDEPALTAKMEEFEKDCQSLRELVKGFEDKVYLILHICYSTERALDKAFPEMLKLPFDQIHIEMANRNYSLVKFIERYGFGDKDIGLGVIDIHNDRLETVEEILTGIQKVLPIIPPERIWVTPDCGLKERSQEVTIAKLKVMVEAAKKARTLF